MPIAAGSARGNARGRLAAPQGYRILGRRFRAGAGEIDIVARKGGTVAFVEVKARADADAALAAVDARTRRRIAAAGRVWLARHPRYAAFTLRYDVILVAGRGLRRLMPRHMISAFLDVGAVGAQGCVGLAGVSSTIGAPVAGAGVVRSGAGTMSMPVIAEPDCASGSASPPKPGS